MSRTTWRSTGGRVRAGLAAAVLVPSAMIGTPAGVAAADAADGTLTVQVLRDFFGTGIINATMDVPQRGIAVQVSDPEGHQVTGTTDATGKVVVPPSTVLAGGHYRVDVKIPAPYSDYLRAAPASTAANHFDSFTTFVDVANGKADSVVTGVWNASDYTLPDNRYFVPVHSGGVGTDTRALVAFGTTTRGTCPDTVGCPTVLATQAQVGTTFGLAYDKNRKRLFQSAFARRHTLYGPDGGNAIHTVPADGSSAPTLFATVPGAAVTAHDTANLVKDAGFTEAPTKESIGGLALSEDGSTLYAVNLLTRALVSFDATGATAASPEATVPIPDPGCAAATDWRPFSVSVHDNKLYVGGVCSAESTQSRSDLKAVVYVYNGSQFTTVLTQVLDFERGEILVNATGSAQGNHWNPWNTALSTWGKHDVNGGGAMIDPQPQLASLAFARDGSMILGFRDRFMDVVAWGGLDPRPGNNSAQNGFSGGDINMACANPAGGYSWEGTGACPDHAATTNDGQQSAGVVEYFSGDYFAPQGPATRGPHQESAQGAVAYIPQQQWVVSTQMDPTTRVITGGTGYYDITTGQGPGNNANANAYEFVGPNQNGFGKAGGLGAIAYQAANAPVQIGNLVWFDGDHNGIQDPADVRLPGATINLLDSTGKQVATTKTDAAGEYYFGGVGASYELTRGAKYTVQFNVCTANTDKVPNRPPATDLRFTLPLVGTDRVHDSNVTPPTSGQLCNGSGPVTAPDNPGEVDHTIDAGVYIPPPPTTTTTVPPTTTSTTTAAPAPPAPSGSRPPLAETGVSGIPWLVGLGVLVLGAGAVLVYAGRRRRANRD
ncbi:LPXTG-motif cell wall-anchored protein [Actinokineospora baliensis]|uniref:SdrD B-like domain-containing protein n=1 Tax=Actinokineospora baliensis TaxID=547056 RepID=UPI001EF94C2F|nr:SdrD B-like domain-containing protein [Actinokineospora baliensis]MBM7774756.1 LPXTG-motif cell wall-anchored protein [Actinokineospora baliensis]